MISVRSEGSQEQVFIAGHCDVRGRGGCSDQRPNLRHVAAGRIEFGGRASAARAMAGSDWVRRRRRVRHERHPARPWIGHAAASGNPDVVQAASTRIDPTSLNTRISFRARMTHFLGPFFP
jgi:hypothetical protein